MLNIRSMNRMTVLIASVLSGACGGPAPLRMGEQTTAPHVQGTLLVGEIVADLSREQITNRFSAADLAAAGWSEADVVDGIAVIAVNFKQSQRVVMGTQVNYTQGLYALLSRDLATSVSARGRASSTARSSSWGGDVVTIRVANKQAGAGSSGGLNIVESIVVPRNAQGDCFYEDHGSSRPQERRHGLYCKSLVAKGWSWIGDEFGMRPAATSR